MTAQKGAPTNAEIGARPGADLGTTIVGEGQSIAIVAAAASSERMTKGEREDLQRLIRQREKVQIAAAKQRSAGLLADFENQLASEYSFDDDEVWEEAEKLAEAEVAKAQKRISDRCRELGIPKQFAPGLSLIWHSRGYSNTVEKRRRELQTVARTRIEAIEAQAVVEIQKASVEAQTQIAIAGLTSEAARAFVSKLPTVEALMPALSFQAIAGDADPPVAEQLVSPNALRQRRYRERQKTLRDASVTAIEASRDADADSIEGTR